MSTVAIDKRKRAPLAQEMEAIAAREGSVSPELVIAEAQKKDTAIHAAFEKAGMFDAKKATQFAQRTFARMLIRRYRVSVTVDDNDPVTVRALVSLTSDRGKDGYRSLVAVMNDEEKREILLADAKREMASFQRKYRMLDELSGVFAAMEAV